MAGGEAVRPSRALQFILLPVVWGPSLHGGELYPLNGPQWSLFLELVANALHAGANRWLTTRRLATLVILSGILLIPVSLHFGGLDVGWSRGSFWGGPPRVAFGFGMGVLIFRFEAQGRLPPPIPFVWIALGLVLCLTRPFPETGHYAVTDLVIVLIVLPVLVALATRATIPDWGLGPALWLGALSYPLYAVHAPLLRLFEAMLERLSDAEAAVGWAVALPIVIAVAALVQRFYDGPSRAWLRRRHARPAPSAL
jgi:peptidoglycan/LPS O-acetylase OafA/YrhL